MAILTLFLLILSLWYLVSLFKFKFDKPLDLVTGQPKTFMDVLAEVGLNMIKKFCAQFKAEAPVVSQVFPPALKANAWIDFEADIAPFFSIVTFSGFNATNEIVVVEYIVAVPKLKPTRLRLHLEQKLRTFLYSTCNLPNNTTFVIFVQCSQRFIRFYYATSETGIAIVNQQHQNAVSRAVKKSNTV